MTKTVKRIGEIGVDAGLCWIGDPCYVLHKEQPPKEIGKNWEEFCDIMSEDDQYPTYKQFNYDLGHPGLGVVVSTGYGDGVYPVYAEFTSEGRVVKVWVDFLPEDESQDDATEADADEGQP
jgi:hypothetical protein